jgi:hypothetical protein
MGNRYWKSCAKKSHHSHEREKSNTEDHENMLEISFELHIISTISCLFEKGKTPQENAKSGEESMVVGIITFLCMFSVFLRGLIFTFGCAMGLFLSFGVVQAASGWLFGDILAKILGITPEQVLTYSWDGTVANAAKLGWLPASDFQRVAPAQSCGAGKCIFGFDPDGNVLCR